MVIKVKLKRKLSYKGHYEYQFVNPAHVQEALVYLKEHNNWYSEIDIKKDSSIKGFSMEESPLDTENEETTEQKDSDHDQQQNGIQYDTCLQPVDIGQEVLDHYFDDIYQQRGKIQCECFKKMEMRQSLSHICFQMEKTHGQRTGKRGLLSQSTLTTD